MRPHDWNQAGNNHADRHNLGADPFHGTVMNRLGQIPQVMHATVFLPEFKSQVKIEQHDHTRLGRDTRQGNDTNPDSN